MPNQPSDLKSFLTAIEKFDFLVIDTETTGLDRTDEICDIAIIDATGNIIINTFIKTVAPIWEEATKIHGITNDMVANSPSWSELQPQIRALLLDKKIITYNATFDRKMFHQSDEAHSLKYYDWQGTSQWFCAMLAFAERFGDWNDYFGNYKWKKLMDAVQFYSCHVRSSHRALADAQMALDVVKCMYTESLLDPDPRGVPFANPTK